VLGIKVTITFDFPSSDDSTMENRNSYCYECIGAAAGTNNELATLSSCASSDDAYDSNHMNLIPVIPLSARIHGWLFQPHVMIFI